MLKRHLQLLQMTCGGLEASFETEMHQPIRPYTHQLTNAFSINLHQRGRTMV